MRVLGIHLLSGQLLYALVEGDKTSPTLIEKSRLIPISTTCIGELMNWFETNFEALITRLQPDKVAHRLTLQPDKKQIIHLEFPLGVLNLICFKHGIPTSNYTPPGYTASKLGMPKTTDLYQHCDDIFGKNPPYWDKNLKNALLAAWFEL